MNAREMLIALAIKYEGEWENIYRDIQNKVFLSQEEIDTYLFKYSEDFVNAVTILDSNYPDYLKNIEKPPFVLFYKGNLNLLNAEDRFGIFGGRKPSTKNIRATINCANDYATQDYVLINNLSCGVGINALRTYNMAGKKSIIVLASGLNSVYPQEHSKDLEKALELGSLVITEYPSFVCVKQMNMAFRIRLLASISNDVVINDIKRTSGTNILFMFALRMNKNVVCIPDTNKKDNYCNELIKEGAIPEFKWCF